MPREKKRPSLSSEELRQNKQESLKAFLDDTQEGKQISAHLHILPQIQERIKAALDYPRSSGGRQDDEVTIEKEFGGYIKKNGIPINLSVIDEESTRSLEEAFNNPQELYSNIAYHTLNDYLTSLGNTALSLIDQPHLRIGKKVAVRRSPKEGKRKGKIERDWAIDSILATGELQVRKRAIDGGYNLKTITIDDLIELNPKKFTKRFLARAAFNR